MSDGYIIQQLDGYTDGKPSWLKVGFSHSREMAERLVEEMLQSRPNQKLRIRKRRARS